MIENESATKSAHHFDFDQTLTKTHTLDWEEGKGPDEEQCKLILKSESIMTLRSILEDGNYVSIITNGSGYRISWVLQKAGLRQDEIEKISIRAAESPLYIVNDFKSNAVRKLANEEWQDAKDHFFYDDRENFCLEVRAMEQEFISQGKSLFVLRVSFVKEDCSHLEYARKMSGQSMLISPTTVSTSIQDQKVLTFFGGSENLKEKENTPLIANKGIPQKQPTANSSENKDASCFSSCMLF